MRRCAAPGSRRRRSATSRLTAPARRWATRSSSGRSRPKDADAIKDDQIRRLQQKVGELVVDVDLLKEALQSARSLGVDATED